MKKLAQSSLTILCATSALISANLCAQTVVHVDANATGANNGTSWFDAFTGLHSALALDGVEAWVAAGTYTPAGPGGDVDATFTLKSGVALYGGFDGSETSRDERDPALNETILSGDIGLDDVYGGGVWYQGWDIHTPNSRHVVTGSAADESAVLDGFTVTAGYASSATSFYDGVGAGMLNVGGSPTLRTCVFLRNLAGFGHGGGVYNLDGSPTFDGCTFRQNYVHLGKGGGIMNVGASSPTIVDCAFVENRCVGSMTEAAGGGISNHSDLPVTVTRCTFERNECVPFYSQGGSITRGGGINNVSSMLTAVNCTFTDNFAHAGAGIFTWDMTTVVDSLFADNTVVAYPVSAAVDQGGFGAGVASGSAQTDVTTLIGCVLANNHGGEAVGVWTGWNHHTVVVNSILWGNTATGAGVTTRGAQIKGSSDILYSCVQGLLEVIPGEDPPNARDYPGSIDEDPLLDGDWHLASGSPCIDAGDNSAHPGWVTHDLAGALRYVDDPATPDTGLGAPPLVDMGAFEYQGACGATGYCATAPNSAGSGALLSMAGSISVAANDFVLSVAGAAPGQFGLFYYGESAAQVPFGDGFRCVDGNTFRLNPPQTVDLSGALDRPVDYTLPPASGGAGAIVPGALWNFQFWYRDPGGPGGTGFNLSDALAIVFCP